MIRILRPAVIGALGATLFAACDSTLGPGGDDPEGVKFSYSGASSGSFASAGEAQQGGGGLPVLESFAVAQRDSIGGLLLGGFRKTGDTRGDLFILQIRGDAPDSYTCAGVTGGPTCYGHLYIGVRTDASAAAEEVYGIQAGEVVLSEVGESRLKGSFQLTLQQIEDQSKTLTIENGSLDVPLVEGVFGASFACLAERLEKGPEAPCE